MNQQAEDSIAQMLNCFPQTSQNYELLFATLDKLLAGQTDQAIIEAAERFASGDVKEQSKKFAPSAPEFVEEVRRRQEYIDIRNRPRLPAPEYRPGPLAPFQIKRQKELAENAHLPVLVEDASLDVFRRLSLTKQIPVGAKWVACLGTIYGPPAKAQSQAA